MSTHNILYQYKKENHPKLSKNTIMSAAMGLFLLGTQERVRNSRGKRAISVRASKIVLYMSD